MKRVGLRTTSGEEPRCVGAVCRFASHAGSLSDPQRRRADLPPPHVPRGKKYRHFAESEGAASPGAASPGASHSSPSRLRREKGEARGSPVREGGSGPRRGMAGSAEGASRSEQRWRVRGGGARGAERSFSGWPGLASTCSGCDTCRPARRVLLDLAPDTCKGPQLTCLRSRHKCIP